MGSLAITRTPSAIHDSRGALPYNLRTILPSVLSKGNLVTPPIELELPAPSISCRYTSEPADQLARPWHLFGLVEFGRPCGVERASGTFSAGLTPLPDHPLREAWLSTTPVRRGSDQRCSWTQTDDLLLIGLAVDEARYPSQRDAIQLAYRTLLSGAGRLGYPHIIRAWNYMADINAGAGDHERYRIFCEGRLAAFVECGYAARQFPSACALGHQGGDTIIYLLASRRAGVHFENPRQLSAYRYPRQYGPASPSFARATLLDSAGERKLFVSGTASIIGHHSAHDACVARQLEATCHNIDALLAHVGASTGGAPAMSLLKVYLRHPADLPVVRQGVRRHFGVDTPTLYVQGDICRRELLVEIDGIAEFA